MEINLELIHCTSESELLKLINQVHDLWLDLDSMHADPTLQTLTFDLYQSSKSMDIVGKLTFFHALHYIRKDTEHIGRYDINSISFNKTDRKIEMTFGIPLKLEILVTEFSIEFRPIEKG